MKANALSAIGQREQRAREEGWAARRPPAVWGESGKRVQHYPNEQQERSSMIQKHGAGQRARLSRTGIKPRHARSRAARQAEASCPQLLLGGRLGAARRPPSCCRAPASAAAECPPQLLLGGVHTCVFFHVTRSGLAPAAAETERRGLVSRAQLMRSRRSFWWGWPLVRSI